MSDAKKSDQMPAHAQPPVQTPAQPHPPTIPQRTTPPAAAVPMLNAEHKQAMMQAGVQQRHIDEAASTKLFDKAHSFGFSPVDVLDLVRKYGPQVLDILNTILDRFIYQHQEQERQQQAAPFAKSGAPAVPGQHRS